MCQLGVSDNCPQAAILAIFRKMGGCNFAITESTHGCCGRVQTMADRHHTKMFAPRKRVRGKTRRVKGIGRHFGSIFHVLQTFYVTYRQGGRLLHNLSLGRVVHYIEHCIKGSTTLVTVQMLGRREEFRLTNTVCEKDPRAPCLGHLAA